jgi:hypothetical protein
MNLFIFNDDPYLAAKDYCNKLNIKIILEAAQLLCTTARVRGFQDVPYKKTHENHPVRKWVGDSSANWNWTCHHGLALCHEYTLRYEKTHKCQSIIQNLLYRTFEIWGENKDYREHTLFAQCMPDQYKMTTNASLAYQNYFKGEKRHMAEWKEPASIPEWYH